MVGGRKVMVLMRGLLATGRRRRLERCGRVDAVELGLCTPD